MDQVPAICGVPFEAPSAYKKCTFPLGYSRVYDRRPGDPDDRRPFRAGDFRLRWVLVEGEPIINQAHAHILTACGYPITERDLVERFCGISDTEMLGVIEREWSRVLPASSAERGGSMIEAGFQSLAAIEGCRSARLAAIARLRCVEQQPGADPSQTAVDRPPEMLWRKSVQCDDGRTR